MLPCLSPLPPPPRSRRLQLHHQPPPWIIITKIFLFRSRSCGPSLIAEVWLVNTIMTTICAGESRRGFSWLCVHHNIYPIYPSVHQTDIRSRFLTYLMAGRCSTLCAQFQTDVKHHSDVQNCNSYPSPPSIPYTLIQYAHIGPCTYEYNTYTACTCLAPTNPPCLLFVLSTSSSTQLPLK